MYIMDFPTAHRLRHKKTTAAQVTTLTQYFKMPSSWPHQTGHKCDGWEMSGKSKQLDFNDKRDAPWKTAGQ